MTRQGEQTFICDGTPTPEAKDEIAMFGVYIRTGGKKAHGSWEAFKAAQRAAAMIPQLSAAP
jgi:hypothetical protein